jgi:capsule polysaccharide export protein KpsE/RkpR
MNNMIPITKNTSDNIIADDEDTTSDFIDLTINFKSEYGFSYYEFRYDKRIKLVEIADMTGYVKAFKNDRFKLIAQCLYMSQTRLVNRIMATARVEMSYAELPF